MVFPPKKVKNSVNFYTMQQHPDPRGLGAFLYTLVTLFSRDKDLGSEWNHNNNPLQYIPIICGFSPPFFANLYSFFFSFETKSSTIYSNCSSHPQRFFFLFVFN